MNNPIEIRRSKNWLLIKVREWHSLLGVWISAFVMLVCASGIYLNHKDLFRFGPAEKQVESGKVDAAGKAAASAKRPGDKATSTVLTTATAVAELGISLPRAMELARAELGETPLETIELKHEKGRYIYKLKLGRGNELLVDARTGELTRKMKEDRAEYKAEEPDKAGLGGYDWGKIIKDLHTGKIGGEAGKLLTDAVALVIMGLTLSGLYLWYVPKYRKRKAEQAARTASRAFEEASGALA
jgi:uncharacterized iron-regulated membrane protein